MRVGARLRAVARALPSLDGQPARLRRRLEIGRGLADVRVAEQVAGLVIPITGEIMRMPGLPKEPMSGRFSILRRPAR